MSEPQPSVESDAHGIVATRCMSGGTTRYTCRCGEAIDAHPDVLGEALDFHLTRVTPSAVTGGK